MKERILYLMHVDWHWIKQRPHFIAEELTSYFDVKVSHPHNNRRGYLVKNKTNLSKIPIISVPFSKYKAINLINVYIKNLYFWVLIFFYRPSVVWFTFPTMIPLFGLNMLIKKVIVYDCMDDAPEFMSCESEKQYILHKEQELLRHADIVLVSSENLRNKLLGRGVAYNKLSLVRNAFGGEEYVNSFSTHKKVIGSSDKYFRITFFGAIGEHLDFDVVLYCVDELKEVEFHFYGPVTIKVPKHNKIIFHGPVEHSKLPELVLQYDCFVMPFKINELIQGVDPVKLYEYINLNKNILCSYYPEIDRFSEFVYFYRSKGEFVEEIKKLIENNEIKYDVKQRKSFLKNNSWCVRAAEISRLVSNLIDSKTP